MNPAAIESHLKLVLLEWAAIIAVSYVFGRLGRRLGQPLAVGEIAAGILLGPSFFGFLFPETSSAFFPAESQQSLQLLAKLGLILLLFQVGMEFDFGHLRTRSRAVAAVSLTGIVVPALCGLAIGRWLHTEFAPETPYLGFQLFVSIAMAISALPIMGRILLEWGLERTALGAVAISAAAVDDVAGWIGLAGIAALVQADFTWSRVLLQTAGVLLLFLMLVMVVGPALGALWRRWGGMTPAFLAVLLLVLFGCCVATNALGVFSIFGAFLFGVSLHRERELVDAWRLRFQDFVLVALVPIFFTNTGLRTEIGSFTGAAEWLGCAAVLCFSVLGKLGGCFAGGVLSGLPVREAASVAALMNTRALMGLVAINWGAELGYLPRELFSMFVVMALGTTAMTGPLLWLCLPPELRALRASRQRQAERGAS